MALPAGASCEGSEGSARIGPPQHELPLSCAGYDDIRACRLPQLCHMQAALQVAARHDTTSDIICIGMYQIEGYKARQCTRM